MMVMNKELKEPSEIVLFAGGIYECIINDSRGRYNQSQLAFMTNLPSQQTIDHFDAILLWIAPPGTQIIQFDQHNILQRTLNLKEYIKEFSLLFVFQCDPSVPIQFHFSDTASQNNDNPLHPIQ